MIGVCMCACDFVRANMCVGGFMVESGKAEREGDRKRDADGEETLNPQYTIQQQRK